MSNKIIIKNGTGAPGTILETAELGYDKIGKKLYSGNGAGVSPTFINPLGVTVDENRSDYAVGINADTLGGLPANTYATFERMEIAVDNALTKLCLQILNKGKITPITNSVMLLSSDGYVLKDSRDWYLTAKEDE